MGNYRYYHCVSMHGHTPIRSNKPDLPGPSFIIKTIFPGIPVIKIGPMGYLTLKRMSEIWARTVSRATVMKVWYIKRLVSANRNYIWGRASKRSRNRVAWFRFLLQYRFINREQDMILRNNLARYYKWYKWLLDIISDINGSGPWFTI